MVASTRLSIVIVVIIINQYSIPIGLPNAVGQIGLVVLVVVECRRPLTLSRLTGGVVVLLARESIVVIDCFVSFGNDE